MLASTLLAKQLTFPGPPPRERDITTSCPSCGQEQSLRDAQVDDDDVWETRYSCRRCHQTILLIGTPGVVPWKGRGYRLGEWVLRNPSELDIHLRTGVIRLSASPHALD
jgi:predicted RNA-binding Zn-ribbon protein involved in translation (DUF1610 family)